MYDKIIKKYESALSIRFWNVYSNRIYFVGPIALKNVIFPFVFSNGYHVHMYIKFIYK